MTLTNVRKLFTALGEYLNIHFFINYEFILFFG